MYLADKGKGFSSPHETQPLWGLEMPKERKWKGHGHPCHSYWHLAELFSVFLSYEKERGGKQGKKASI